MENINPQPITPVQESNPTPTSNISATPPPRNKSKMILGLIILFIILFFGSAAAIGMKVFSDINNEKVLIPSPSPTPTLVSPTSYLTPTTQIDTSNFKSVSTTFADFQIPEKWHLWKCNETAYILADWGAQENPEYGCEFDSPQAMFINLSDKSYQTVDEAVPTSKNYGAQTSTISDVKKITVDGKNAAQWKDEIIMNPGEEELPGTGSYLNVFILTNIFISTDEDKAATLDQILSTWKFKN